LIWYLGSHSVLHVDYLLAKALANK